MSELPDNLEHHDGKVIYDPPDVGTDTACLIASASTEKNGDVTAEMVRRYNLHNELVEALAPFAKVAEVLAGTTNYPEKYQLLILSSPTDDVFITGADLEAAREALRRKNA